MMSRRSQATLFSDEQGALILSAEARPVSPRLLPDGAKARRTSDGSGQIFCELCGGVCRDGCWQRTLAESLLSSLKDLTGLSLNWKRRVIKSRFTLLVLGQWGRHIEETGCGSSARQTITATDAKGRSYTYSAGDHGKPFLALTGQAQALAWPTPASRDWKDSGQEPAAQARKSPGLPAATVIAGQADPESRSTTGNRLGSLNADWVETLMGFPVGWTDLDDESVCALLGTRSSRRSSPRSDEQSCE